MDPFEYTVVLTSLIIGLGIAQLLTGTADVLSNVRNVKLCLPHALVVVKVFLLCVQDWWFTYQYALDVDSWTIRMVLFVSIYPILLFVYARMLFPTGLRSQEADLNSYYYDQWQWFFTVELLIVIASISHNLIISGYTLIDQIPLLIYEVIFIVFIAFRINNRRAHVLFQVLSLLFVMVLVFVQDDGLMDYQSAG